MVVLTYYIYRRRLNMKVALLFTAAALSLLNPFDAIGAELTSLSPGTNEVHFGHDGHSRRLIVTASNTSPIPTARPATFQER